MLLIVILNAVLALTILSVIVALHAKAISADQAQQPGPQVVPERHRRPRTATAQRAAVRPARGPLTSAG